jgi:predicted dehydrogenase/threonine dehydrogenase-like Zn-dependent dehydrogenase
MKQLLQNLKSGKTELVEQPLPSVKDGDVLIQTHSSLVSAGTERMLVDFGKAGLIGKARSQPDKVKQVIDKVKTDGLATTVHAVRSKLDQPIPLGYCNVGVIIEAKGERHKAKGFAVGERVVSNGPHAEVVSVPANLCARVPETVADEEATFTVIGAIGLQGIRLVQPTLGECFVVTGLGLIGQMTAQLLVANGCKVLGIDMDTHKCRLAENFGVRTVDLSKHEDPVEAAREFSRGNGVDGVIITAATKSSQPVHQAALMCRRRGRIVLVGVTGLELSRADFYEKELSFQVSCSYGPGRYDPKYEEKGLDYPIGFVRWTEQRNFEAVLDMMAAGKLDVKPLISHRFRFEEAEKAYELISENKEPYLGIILEYGEAQSSELKAQSNELPEGTVSLKDEPKDPQISQINADLKKIGDDRTIRLKDAETNLTSKTDAPVVGVIGAGNFTGQVLLPAIAKNGVRLKSIASSGGVSGTHFGKKFGFELSTTDTQTIFDDTDINTVFITTRHNSHARFVLQALTAGKNVFVEKPLCLTLEELEEIQSTADPRRQTQTLSSADLAEDKLSAAARQNHLTDNHCTNPPIDTDSSDSTISLNADSNAQRATRNPKPILMVGFNRRFAPQVMKMKELLRSTVEPLSMIMTVNAGYIPSEHWTQDPEVGGGRIVGEACHFIDLLRFLCGYRIADHRITVLNNQFSDTVSIDLTFEDGSIGTIHYFANGSKRFAKERLEVFSGGRILQLDNFRVLKGYGWQNFKRMKLWGQDKGHAAGVKAFLYAAQYGMAPPIPFEEIFETTRLSIELSGAI